MSLKIEEEEEKKKIEIDSEKKSSWATKWNSKTTQTPRLSKPQAARHIKSMAQILMD
jgi:hypothetical protein